MSSINQQMRWVQIGVTEEGGPLLELQYTVYNVMQGCYEWQAVPIINIEDE